MVCERRPSPPAAFEDAAAVSLYASRCVAQRPTIRSRENRPDPALAGGRNEARQALAAYEHRERQGAIAEAVKDRLVADLEEGGKCVRCMLQRQHCICSRLQRLRESIIDTGAAERVRFVVWMHCKERKRASNTGKLLESIMPGSEVVLHDCKDDVDRFEVLLAESGGPHRAFVLFPSDAALSLPEALARAEAAVEQDAATPSGEGYASPPPPLLVVLVDGTWRQARRMRTAVPSLSDVSLVAVGRSEFHWRRQSEEGRISTIEAAALLLEQMGEAPEAAPAALRSALGVLCEALDGQCYYDRLAGLDLPEPSSQKRAAVANRLPKRGPGLRSYSDTTSLS